MIYSTSAKNRSVARKYKAPIMNMTIEDTSEIISISGCVTELKLSVERRVSITPVIGLRASKY